MKSILFLSLISLSATACIDQLDDDQVDTTEVPRLAANGMTPAQIQVTSLDASALTGTAIAPYATTADGRSFLSYLVGCALNSSQTLTTGAYSFTGGLGLATSWTSGAISLSDRRWVSACMLARANSGGSSVGLSLRGTHAQLFLSGEGGYAVQEGAFYGDIFAGGNVRNVCADVDVRERPMSGTLKTRLCAHGEEGIGQPTPCGFTFAGNCETKCSLTSPNYTSCTDASGATWTEVIKVNTIGY
jgi:hypothetical protein